MELSWKVRQETTAVMLLSNLLVFSCLLLKAHGLELSLGEELEKSLVKNAARVNKLTIKVQDIMKAKTIIFPHGEKYIR